MSRINLKLTIFRTIHFAPKHHLLLVIYPVSQARTWEASQSSLSTFIKGDYALVILPAKSFLSCSLFHTCPPQCKQPPVFHYCYHHAGNHHPSLKFALLASVSVPSNSSHQYCYKKVLLRLNLIILFPHLKSFNGYQLPST